MQQVSSQQQASSHPASTQIMEASMQTWRGGLGGLPPPRKYKFKLFLWPASRTEYSAGASEITSKCVGNMSDWHTICSADADAVWDDNSLIYHRFHCVCFNISSNQQIQNSKMQSPNIPKANIHHPKKQNTNNHAHLKFIFFLKGINFKISSCQNVKFPKLEIQNVESDIGLVSTCQKIKISNKSEHI